MSYWVVRDVNRNAIMLLDNEPEQEIFTGAEFWYPGIYAA